MNLVAKEFVAARDDLDGVLILSELAGAAQELSEALIINPYDERGFTAAIARAIEMPAWERRRRMQALRRRVAGRDVLAWASDILDRLERRKGRGSSLGRHDAIARRALRRRRTSSRPTCTSGWPDRHLLLLTDFDGTLADLAPTPAEAALSDVGARARSTRLRAFDVVTFGVVSGRRLDDVARARRAGGRVRARACTGSRSSGPSRAFHHYALDSVEPVIATLARDAARELAWCPGRAAREQDVRAHVPRPAARRPSSADRALEEFEALAEPQLEARRPEAAHRREGARAAARGRLAQGPRRRVDPRARRAARRPRRCRSSISATTARTKTRSPRSATTTSSIGVGERPHTHLIDWRLAGPPSVGRFFARARGLSTGQGGRAVTSARMQFDVRSLTFEVLASFVAACQDLYSCSCASPSPTVLTPTTRSCSMAWPAAPSRSTASRSIRCCPTSRR